MIISMPIPTIFLACFFTLGSHSHFIKSHTRQGDRVDKVLFTLTHLHIFHPTILAHLTCVFPSFANDMHIVGIVSNVVPAILQL